MNTKFHEISSCGNCVIPHGHTDWQINMIKGKGKGTVTLEQAMKSQRRSRGIAVLFL